MKPTPAYLTIGTRTLCDHMGCKAGLDLTQTAGVQSCSHASKRAAQDAAKALRGYTSAPVRVIAGVCPSSKG